MSQEDNTGTFRKRSGCTDRGKDYEHLYLASLILKLVTDNAIKNFQLSSNDDSFGAFDDVVLEIEHNDRTKQIFAIQLKHKGRCLTKEALTTKSGNFSIKKYFIDFTNLQSFSHPVNYILLTNLKFGVPNNTAITLADDDFDVVIKDGQQETLLNTSPNGRCCYLTSSNRKYEDFFKTFFLYTDQESVDKLKMDTMIKFKQFFICDDDIFEHYLQFITRWSLLEGRKDKLNKNYMLEAIVIRLLSPYVMPLSFSSDGINNKSKLFRDAIFNFQVTCIKEQNIEKVKTIWSDLKNTFDLTKLNKINKKYQITATTISSGNDLSDKDFTKLLWLMGLCPLPLITNECFEKVINLCENHHFLLFGTTNSTKTFHKLSDLGSETYAKIVKEFNCSLQAKNSLTLEQLIEKNPKICTLITTNELVQMLDHSFNIGGKKEILPIPHIDRILTRNIIKLDFLNKTTKTVIVINSVKDEDEQKIRSSSINNITLTPVKDFWKKNVPKDQHENGQVFISDNECSQKEVEDICDRMKTKKYHQFRMFRGELEWIRSQSDINDLKEFRIDSEYIEQTDLFNQSPENCINIICADPGMGKSILMKNLKNSSKFWTILIQPKDHSKYFRDKNTSGVDFLNYIVNKLYNSCFVSQLVKILIEDGQLELIWDGLDEAAEENLKVILKIIKDLSSKGFTQWLTSRCNLKNTLETEFNILSRTIEQFDSEQQNSYIEKRLNCTGSDLSDIKEKIHKCIRLVQYNDILGIPLQIYMFTELFRQNPDKYRTLLSSIFSITDLYRHFVEEKFNIYHQIKANLDDSNDMMRQIMERSKTERLKQYEEAALKTYLTPEILDSLKINCESFLESIQFGCDGVGIIVDVTDEGKPSFLHNSYGEYFAAAYLQKNYTKIPGFTDFIFEESFNNIRFLFDLLMAEECPAHVAVLYKNVHVLEMYESDVGRKDKGGRNPLHLACSWGKRFDFNGTQINQDAANEAKEDTPEYQKILNFLCERCDPLEVDNLFKMNSFNYGDHACCLLPILVLSNKYKFDFAVLKNFNDIKTILYNSVKFDYADVVEDMPSFTTEGVKSFLHLAVQHGSINCLKKMITNPEYLPAINSRNGDGGITPLLVACHKGYLEIIKILITAGADINATNANGYSGIYIAARFGRVEVLKLLLASGLNIDSRNESGQTALFLICKESIQESVSIAQLLIYFGADVNTRDNFGYTPLYIACRHRKKDIIDLLLENNADVNIPNDHGDLPLFMAAWSNQLDIVKLLLEKGADINGVNKRGHGPIHAACLNNLEDVLAYLIGAKAEVNLPNKYGQTPLHLAVRHHFSAGIVMLLKAGADVELLNKHGENFWQMGIRYFEQPNLVDLIVKAKGWRYWNWFNEQFVAFQDMLKKSSPKRECITL